MTVVPTSNEGFPTKTAGYRISTFIRSFTKLIFVAMGMAVVGLGMKFSAIAVGNYVFVFAMAVLTLLFLVQIGLSFFFVISKVRLALLGSICSVALVLGLIALIFRYQDWYGWQITFFIALPVFLVTTYYLVRYFRKRETFQSQHRIFLYQNLILPYFFIFLLSLIVAVSPAGNQDHLLNNSPIDPQPAVDSSALWRAY